MFSKEEVSGLIWSLGLQQQTGTTSFLKGSMSHAAVMLLCIAQAMMFQQDSCDIDLASQTINLGLGKSDKFLVKLKWTKTFLEDLQRFMNSSDYYLQQYASPSVWESWEVPGCIT